LSEARGLIRHARVAGDAYRVDASGPVSHGFQTAFTATPGADLPLALPRTWSQVEALVEKRLALFEARHSAERQEAFERGRIEGRREQESEVTHRLEAAREPWQKLQAAVRKELSTYHDELYRGTTELAAALARAWLGSVVEVNPAVFEAGIRQALEALGEQEQIEVKLHPEDYEAFRQGQHDPDALLMEPAAVTVVADPQVDRGGAVATARGGTADARLSVRVQKALEWLNLLHESR
jgi:flagellar assembly protein FliH